MDQLVATETHKISPEELQRIEDNKAMAQQVKIVGNNIINGFGLDKGPNGSNLAWVMDGKDSFTSLQLKAAINSGAIEGRGITVMLGKVEPEAKLQEICQNQGLSPEDVPYLLTKEFLTRLGFTVPESKEWNVENEPDYPTDNSVTFSHPDKPFTAKCRVEGTAGGGPRLVNLMLVPKSLSPAAA